MVAPGPIAYLDGEFLPKREAHISPDDRGFLFADGVYEVVRSYGGRLFAVDAHVARLQRSLAAVRIAWPEAVRLGDIGLELLRRNGIDDADGTIYLQVTRGVAPRHHPFPSADTPPTVYASASRIEPVPAHWVQGIRVILVPDVRWGRCDIKSLSLLPNVLAAEDARQAGADEAVFVRDGVVTEGTRTNVAIVVGNSLVTHPADHRILPGITRGVVLSLCAEIGLAVREQPFTSDELRGADEVLVIGTTKEVTPAVVVDDRPIGSGRPGPVARRLEEAYQSRIARL